MLKFKGVAAKLRKNSPSFTLIEMLTVIAIIAILIALVISASASLIATSMRSRARTEIQAMGVANEGYKTDNGLYVQSDGVLTTNSPYTSDDGTTVGGEYQTNSTLLYQALSGQTNFVTALVPGAKFYMQFKINQVANQSGISYIHDPWNASYGYSTGTVAGASPTNYPYNGSGFFDLWSAAGVTKAKVTSTPALTNAWIRNWTQ